MQLNCLGPFVSKTARTEIELKRKRKYATLTTSNNKNQ